MKTLRDNPTPELAVELLKETAYRANCTLFRSLFSKANPAVINDTPLGGSSALDGLLRRAQARSPWSTDTETKEETETLECIEMLLDAGAKRRPCALPILDVAVAKLHTVSSATLNRRFRKMRTMKPSE